ncbi:MAG: septal ring lytic transglycosylase RlpA family protein [Balneolaceae bacterium]
MQAGPPVFSLILLSLFLFSCDVTGINNARGEFVESGIASWYGSDYHGGPTASGEPYDMDKLTAAHKTLPLQSIVRVVNLNNGRAVNVRINDRGPFVQGRVIDLSRKAAWEIGIVNSGLTEVELYLIR